MSGGWYWCYRCSHRVSLPATCASASEPVCPRCGEGFLEQEAAAGASPLFRAFLLTGEEEDNDDDDENGLLVDEDEADFQELEDEVEADIQELEDEEEEDIDELEDEELRVSRRLCRSAMITDDGEDEDEDGDEEAEDEDEHDDEYEDDDLDIHWLGSGPSWASRAGLGSIVLGFSRSPVDSNGINSNDERFGSLPASRAAIDAMPVLKFNGQFGADDDMQCAVCKDAFVKDVEIRQMPCGHFYHSDCILPWLALHSSCPVCRMEMPHEGASVTGNGEQEREHEEENRHGLAMLRMASSATGFAIFGFDSPADNAGLMVHPEYMDNQISTANGNSRDNTNDSSAFGSSDDEWHNPLDWFLRQ